MHVCYPFLLNSLFPICKNVRYDCHIIYSLANVYIPEFVHFLYFALRQMLEYYTVIMFFPKKKNSNHANFLLFVFLKAAVHFNNKADPYLRPSLLVIPPFQISLVFKCN